MEKQEPVFYSRHLESEWLYFKGKHFQKGDLVVVLTDGGAEMAYPTCFLLGGVLRVLDDPNWKEGHVEGVHGHRVWIFDDGELDDETIACLARTLKNSGAESVMVASIVVSRRIRRRAGRRVIDRVVARKWRENLPENTILWSDPPSRPAEYWLDSLFEHRLWLAQMEAK
ncbi:MAG: phosphoribosyltransferase [Proteobacteria bacterium]|jgi:hypothetical protein|nr:phosphoribosyltransferase [Pseudomonadota bacterium]